MLFFEVIVAIGLVTSFWQVGKNHLMGCLVLPVILYFIL
jgi:TctA family transporter